MEDNKLTIHSDLILVLIVYSILAISSTFYHHYYLGADGISYVSIAVKYFDGDWFNAINAYWSPLYSWLIVPILCFIGDTNYYAAYVTRIVSFVAGFITLIGLSRMGTAFKLSKTIKRIMLITSVPMILYYSIMFDTPDVLVLCLVVNYFSFIFNENYPNSWMNGGICGLLGGMGFLSKTYIFLFFLAHFVFFNFLYYFKDRKMNKKGIRRNFIIGLIVFFVISGLWVGTLSLKYDEITIGTTTKYNHAITGPEYPTHPVYFMGLIKPPNNSATSTWEEPSLVNLSDWSPLESWEYMRYQLELISKNLLRFFIFLEYHSFLTISILILSLYFIFKQGTRHSFKNGLIYIMVTLLIYSAGYLLIHVQDRYIWPVILLSMFCSFYLLENLYQDKIFGLKLRNVLMITIMLSFILFPVSEIFFNPPIDVNTYSFSQNLKKDYNIQGNIASNDQWEPTNRISFYLDSQYYGLPKNTTNSVELEEELVMNNINYYFVWGNSDKVELITYKEITNDRIAGLKIYRKISKNNILVP